MEAEAHVGNEHFLKEQFGISQKHSSPSTGQISTAQDYAIGLISRGGNEVVEGAESKLNNGTVQQRNQGDSTFDIRPTNAMGEKSGVNQSG